MNNIIRLVSVLLICLFFTSCVDYVQSISYSNGKYKMYYYRGIKNWKNERGFLHDTCLTGQDAMKATLDYFGVKYND